MSISNAIFLIAPLVCAFYSFNRIPIAKIAIFVNMSLYGLVPLEQKAVETLLLGYMKGLAMRRCAFDSFCRFWAISFGNSAKTKIFIEI